MEDTIQHTHKQHKKQQALALALALLLTLTGLLGGAAAAQTQVTVQLLPSTTAIGRGETVDVALRVKDVRSLYGAQLDLYFDPALLIARDADPLTKGVQVTLGNFLSPDFVVFNDVDNETGTLRLAFTQVSPHPPVEGSGDLATVTFEGVGLGSATLTWGQVVLADMDGQEIIASLEGAEIQVEQRFSTLTLLASGAGILGIALASLVGWMWAARRQVG